MDNGTQSTHLKQRVLIAANQDEPLADELVSELCIQGLDAVKIENLQQASQADEAAACIVILRPVTWRSAPFITTAMRCNSPYLIEPRRKTPVFRPDSYPHFTIRFCEMASEA
jgi:hypothetical protein